MFFWANAEIRKKIVCYAFIHFGDTEGMRIIGKVASRLPGVLNSQRQVVEGINPVLGKTAANSSLLQQRETVILLRRRETAAGCAIVLCCQLKTLPVSAFLEGDCKTQMNVRWTQFTRDLFWQ